MKRKYSYLGSGDNNEDFNRFSEVKEGLGNEII